MNKNVLSKGTLSYGITLLLLILSSNIALTSLLVTLAGLFLPRFKEDMVILSILFSGAVARNDIIIIILAYYLFLALYSRLTQLNRLSF
jgi:hypothetical protein